MLRTALVLSASLLIPALRTFADDPLPKAEALIDQYIEATGGKAAYEKLKNRTAKGTIEVTGAGLKGTIREVSAMPNKSFQEIDLPGQGKATGGTDGQVVWELSDIQGPRVVEGEERESKLREYTFNDDLRWREIYAKAECTGVEDVKGKPCYKLVLTPKSGKPLVEFLDKTTHLVVKAITTDQSPLGEITIEVYPDDYKKVDGVLIPHKIAMKVLTNEMVVRFDEIKHNVDLPPDQFKVPDGVKPLLKKDEK